MCWGFSSWSRGFRAFLVPSNPPGTKCQGWFSWWLSDPPTAPTREGSLLGGFQNAKPQQWICWRFLGHWAPHPDCAEAAWRENPSHDKEMETNGAGPLSSGAQCLQSWQLLPALSQLTQHSCQRSPGRAAGQISFAVQLFQAGTEKFWHLELSCPSLSPGTELWKWDGVSSSLGPCSSHGRPGFVPRGEIPLPLWSNPIHFHLASHSSGSFLWELVASHKSQANQSNF